MEIDKYQALLEKAKDFDNLRNGGIWKIVEELVEAVEDLLEESPFLASGTCVAREKQVKIQGMREAAKLCAAIKQSTIPGNAQEAVIFHLGFTEGRKNCERAALARAEEIEKELRNEK